MQAMVALGMQNSRMKDFYDLWIIARQFSFEGETLVMAIGEIFNRRHTELPLRMPTGLSDEFANDEYKITQWTAFLARSQLEGAGVSLVQVINELRTFLIPVLDAAANSRNFSDSWANGGPWDADP